MGMRLSWIIKTRKIKIRKIKNTISFCQCSQFYITSIFLTDINVNHYYLQTFVRVVYRAVQHFWSRLRYSPAVKR